MNMFLTLVMAGDCGKIMPDPYEEDHDELIRAGIDPEKLGYMKRSERCRIIAAAGLNPSDYDF